MAASSAIAALVAEAAVATATVFGIGGAEAVAGVGAAAATAVSVVNKHDRYHMRACYLAHKQSAAHSKVTTDHY